MPDSFAGNDVARLAFDGVDNSTTITDALGHTFTANGTAKLKTTKPKYGTASLLLDGTTNCCVSSPNSADWNLGSGDFCVDFFYEATTWATGAGHDLFGIGDGTLEALRLTSVTSGSGGTLALETSISSAISVVSLPVASLVAGTTYHVVVKRFDTAFSISIDGMTLVEDFRTGALDWNTSMILTIGGSFTGQNPNGGTGYIDQFRLTKGVARYQSTGFTPPVDGNFNTVDSTITTTSLGQYTRQVSVYGPSTNVDAIIEAVDRAIVALGWELYDSIYKGTVTKIYRATNLYGGPSKFTMLIWDKVRRKVTHTSMESWDRVTRTITNETWSNFRADGQHGFALNLCDIILFGSERYLGMMTYVQGSNSTWSLCVENEREAAEDTDLAGFPCWGMTYGHTALHRSVATNITDWIRMPRTRDGAVGVNASRNISLVTSLGVWSTATAAIGGSALTSFAARYNSASSTGQHGWDNTKRLITSMKIIKDNALTDLVLHIYGRWFGLKATPPIANAETMDRQSLPVDVHLFYDPAGSTVQHWILPSPLNAASAINGGGASVPSVSAFSVGAIGVQDMVSTGSHAYLATTSSGVSKTNLTTGITTAVAGTSGLITAICFDGRYVYAATTTGVARIDTISADAVTNLTVGVGGVKAMTLHGKQFLFVSQRTASVTCTVHKIDLQSFTAGASTNITAKTTASNINALASDGLKTICAVSGNATTAADQTISYIDMETMTPTNVSFPATPLGNAQGVMWTGQHWMVSVLTDSSIVNTYLMTGNTGTSLATLVTMTATNVTTASPNKVCLERAGPAMQIIIPTTAVAAPASGGGIATQLPSDYAAAATTLGISGSTFTATSGARCAASHGNSLLIMGVDNNLYVVGLLNRKNTTSTNHPNLLIPK